MIINMITIPILWQRVDVCIYVYISSRFSPSTLKIEDKLSIILNFVVPTHRNRFELVFPLPLSLTLFDKMPYMPPEILLFIVRFADDDTLKILRLSNSTLEAFATPVLAQRKFESINVHITTRKLQWFHNVCNCEPFASHINSITLRTIAPSQKRINDLASALNSGLLGSAQPRLRRAIHHLSRYLNEYEGLCESGYTLASLRGLFEALRRTRDFSLRIKITDDNEHCFDQHDMHTIAFLPDHILNGALCWSESDGVRIMLALNRSGLHPKSLSLSATPTMAGCSLQHVHTYLDSNIGTTLAHTYAFTSLESCEIELPSAFLLDSTSALANAMEQATHLGSLALRGWDMNYVGNFSGRFRDLDAVKTRVSQIRSRGSLRNIIPKQGLRNLRLRNLLIEAEDLTSLMKENSATLETVRLRSLVICGDSREFSDLCCDEFPQLQYCKVWGLRNFTGDTISRWSPPYVWEVS